MQTTYIVIVILLILDIAVMLLARWFDKRYYVPFLTATMGKQEKDRFITRICSAQAFWP